MSDLMEDLQQIYCKQQFMRHRGADGDVST